MSGTEPFCTYPATAGLPSAARGGPASHALSRVARLHRIAAARLLKEADLYPGQEFLMMALWDCGPVRQSALIQSLGLDPSTVTKMLQRLEQCGHVRRRPDPDDRRAVLVEPTEEGEALRSRVEAAWATLEERTLAGLDADDRAQLTRLLARLEENLCGEAGECGPENR
ncbi:MarR family winged helix-turn-helix transcriptional regulator [Streptomyces sp. SKN60]|uniref:MarR family winged helix-turn-helix transcriptional regulator n=1 Tax=Streptomyces TaxID=1883 RepID=UPI002245AEE2|nr:MarR family winged helix-turn-helix transcriptional regulator [Streptomyces sp. SKN60]MCX2182987.1 MarR family winged helix-turn-helix transcriptional regulator [Streptomyces sp. SKN60]